MTENKEQIKVLIVDDHKLTRIGIKRVLELGENFNVLGEADDGEKALSFVEENTPDVILMDVAMPEMDGIEAARQLKKSHPQVHIIMLTSTDNESHIFASLAAGAVGYCLKDIEPDRLCATIKSVCQGELWLDATIAGKVLNQYAKGNTPVKSEPESESLSPRELEVLALLVEGLSNRAIASRLSISLSTVKTHVANILTKLAVDDRTNAAVKAMREGLI